MCFCLILTIVLDHSVTTASVNINLIERVSQDVTSILKRSLRKGLEKLLSEETEIKAESKRTKRQKF